MAQTVGRNVAAPLLFINLIMYLLIIGFASWCIDRYINGQTNHPSKFMNPTSLSVALSLSNTYTRAHYVEASIPPLSS